MSRSCPSPAYQHFDVTGSCETHFEQRLKLESTSIASKGAGVQSVAKGEDDLMTPRDVSEATKTAESQVTITAHTKKIFQSPGLAHFLSCCFQDEQFRFEFLHFKLHTTPIQHAVKPDRQSRYSHHLRSMVCQCAVRADGSIRLSHLGKILVARCQGGQSASIRPDILDLGNAQDQWKSKNTCAPRPTSSSVGVYCLSDLRLSTERCESSMAITAARMALCDILNRESIIAIFWARL